MSEDIYLEIYSGTSISNLPVQNIFYKKELLRNYFCFCNELKNKNVSD